MRRATIALGWALMLLVVLVARDGRASGFAVNEQNARGLGSAFAGEAAAAEDAGTVYFNPAGLTLLTGTQIVASGFAIKPTVDFHNHGSTLNAAVGGGPLAGGNDGNGGSMALLQTLFLSHQLTDRLWLGFGVSTPFGLATSWTPGWVGRYHGIDSSLITVNVNPSLAAKLTDWLSVGGGADIEYAKARLTNALDMGSICQIFGARQGVPPAVCTNVLGLKPQRVDGFVRVRGDDWNASYNAGLLLTPTPRTRVGLAYRSWTHHTLGGQESFLVPKKAVPLRRISGALVDTGGRAAVDLPERVALSAFHQVTSRWALLADVTWTRWSRFQDLVIQADNPKQPTITEHENWNDSYRYSFGVRYDPTRQWSLRLGTAYDETPVPDDHHRTPRIPDSDRIWATWGVGYRWTDRVRIHFGYAHIFALRAGTATPDPVTGHILRGHFTAHADIVGLGLTYDLGWPLWPPWGRRL